jgi:hypothetical protein
LVTATILGVYQKSEVYSIGIYPTAGSASPRSHYVFPGVFIAEVVDGAGDEGSGDTTMVDVQTILEDFLKNVPEICMFHQ